MLRIGVLSTKDGVRRTPTLSPHAGRGEVLVIARSEATKHSRSRCHRPLDCFASLAMTRYEQSRSRDAFLRPSLAKPLHESVASKKIRGGGAPNGANGSIRTGTSDERIRTAGQCGARHEWSALPRASACGRARLSALRRGTCQLRAALPETESGL